MLNHLTMTLMGAESAALKSITEQTHLARCSYVKCSSSYSLSKPLQPYSKCSSSKKLITKFYNLTHFLFHCGE